MEGMLQRWALIVQEFNFDIVYRRGILNTSADALSRRDQTIVDITALRSTSIPIDKLKQCQQQGPTITQIYKMLSAGSPQRSGRQWQRPPLHLRCYHQIL